VITNESGSLGVYLFSWTGVLLLAAPAGERLPIEPAQVEGLLALAGGFSGARGDAPAAEAVTRVRYDDYQVLGIRGNQTVAASVSRDAAEDVLVPELERFLKRCEKRLQRQGHH